VEQDKHHGNNHEVETGCDFSCSSVAGGHCHGITGH
jgi:hypothetical protein